MSVYDIMEKKILWNTLIDENVNLKIININRVKKKKIRLIVHLK